ncbi:hypothetical protein DFO45_2277 [Azorhizobium sp. AG788]|nr:hypothetical protein DFO45_2277 [Azorhizobium sp. AG788]
MRIDGAGIRDLCVVSGDLVYCLAQELARQCGAPQIVAA